MPRSAALATKVMSMYEFIPAKSSSAGLGAVGAEQRVRLVGGDLELPVVDLAAEHEGFGLRGHTGLSIPGASHSVVRFAAGRFCENLPSKGLQRFGVDVVEITHGVVRWRLRLLIATGHDATVHVPDSTGDPAGFFTQEEVHHRAHVLRPTNTADWMKTIEAS